LCNCACDGRNACVSFPGGSPMSLYPVRGLPRLIAPWLLFVFLVACSSPTPTSPGRGDAAASGPSSTTAAGPRGTIKLAYPTEPEILNARFASGSGLNEFNWIFNSYLTYYDFGGVSHPMLAEE